MTRAATHETTADPSRQAEEHWHARILLLTEQPRGVRVLEAQRTRGTLTRESVATKRNERLDVPRQQPACRGAKERMSTRTSQPPVPPQWFGFGAQSTSC